MTKEKLIQLRGKINNLFFKKIYLNEKSQRKNMFH